MMRLWLAPNLKGFEQTLEAFARMSGARGGITLGLPGVAH
jgi:hypothetical protein